VVIVVSTPGAGALGAPALPSDWLQENAKRCAASPVPHPG
jgi:hypothetical protein